MRLVLFLFLFWAMISTPLARAADLDSSKIQVQLLDSTSDSGADAQAFPSSQYSVHQFKPSPKSDELPPVGLRDEIFENAQAQRLISPMDQLDRDLLWRRIAAGQDEKFLETKYPSLTLTQYEALKTGIDDYNQNHARSEK